MSTVITEQEARERFESGHVVGIRPVNREHNVWLSAAAGWAKSFEEFRDSSRWWGDGLETEFVKPRAGRRTQDEAAGHIFRREEFTIGNISGTHFFSPEATGDLEEEYHESFRGASYAVWSYETPIAWVSQDGTIVMPPLRYSQTTSQHQRLTAGALRVPFHSERRSKKAGSGRTPYTNRAW